MTIKQNAMLSCSNCVMTNEENRYVLRRAIAFDGMDHKRKSFGDHVI